MIVLGINAYHGDASAALFRDGQLLAAVEEERFTRVKHAAGFPSSAVRWCLESNGVDAAEIDHVAIARKRSAHLARKTLWALRLPHLTLGRSRAWKRFGDICDTVGSVVSDRHGRPSAAALALLIDAIRLPRQCRRI